MIFFTAKVDYCTISAYTAAHFRCAAKFTAYHLEFPSRALTRKPICYSPREIQLRSPVTTNTQRQYAQRCLTFRLGKVTNKSYARSFISNEEWQSIASCTPAPLSIGEISLETMMSTNMFTLVSQVPIDHSATWLQCRATWQAMLPIFISTNPSADDFMQALLNYVSSTHFSNQDDLDQLELNISTVVRKLTSEPTSTSVQTALSQMDEPIRLYLSVLQLPCHGLDHMLIGCCAFILRLTKSTIPPPSFLGSSALPPDYPCPPSNSDTNQDEMTQLLLTSSITKWHYMSIKAAWNRNDGYPHEFSAANFILRLPFGDVEGPPEYSYYHSRFTSSHRPLSYMAAMPCHLTSYTSHIHLHESLCS